jgi:membrane peptidoglycan carboxypeptidase
MGSDTRDPYQRDMDGRRSGGPTPRRSGPPDGRGAPGRASGAGPRLNGLIRPPGIAGGSGPSSAAGRARGRPGGRDEDSRESDSRYDSRHGGRADDSREYDSRYDSRAGASSSQGRGRTIGDRFREAGRSITEQFSAMVGRAERAVRDRQRGGGAPDRGGSPGRRAAGPRTPPPALASGELATMVLPYRRSRARLLARKWRMKRVRPNPLGYALGIASLVLVLSALGGSGGAGGAYAATYYYQNRGLIQQTWDQRVARATRIYDRNGILLYTMSGNTGFQFYEPYALIDTQHCATCKDRNNWIIKATVDIEDRSFWSNPGFNLLDTARAALVDTSAGGQAQQGASTITQQLVKLLVIKNNEKTITRKLHELILSYGVTQEYEKWQILEMYLNNIPYGDNNTGIEAAARNFFGLDVVKGPDGQTLMTASQQLDLAQAALLARLPNAPSTYLPVGQDQPLSCATAPCPQSVWSGPKATGNEEVDYVGATEVLDSMKSVGDITDAQEAQAKSELVDMFTNQHIYHWKWFRQNAHSSEDTTKRAPHFVNEVIRQLEDTFGLGTDAALEQAGLNVYTTLDWNLELEMETDALNYIQKPFTQNWYCAGDSAYSCGTHPPLDDPQFNVNNAAGVAIDPWTGDVLAMMGSVDYGNPNPQVRGFVNMAMAQRSMGSATKPLIYATSFQMGWTPGTMLDDSPICFGVAIPPQAAPGQSLPPNAKATPDPAAPSCILPDKSATWYVPHDFETTSFSGRAPVREVLANSLNIPATEAMDFVGDAPSTAQNFLAMAGRLGIVVCKKQQCDTANGENGLSFARMGPTTVLGAQEIPLIQLTSAYGAFPTLGKHTPYRMILRIDGPDGSTLYTAPAPKLAQAMSPEAAYMMTSILNDNLARVPDFGNNNPLWLPAWPSHYPYDHIAAKTGTSQGPMDIVTMGYSPYMVLGVWAGNTDGGDPVKDVIGITGSGYIFHDTMLWAAKHYKWPESVDFARPSDMVYAQLGCNAGLAPYKGTSSSGEMCKYNPSPVCAAERKSLGYNPCLNLYGGYLISGGGRPDWDWVVKNMIPDLS